MKLIGLLYIVCLLSLCGQAEGGIRKSGLKVLYVGGSPDIDNMASRPDSAAVARSVTRRMASFEKMLKRYFKQVVVINAADYRPALSAEYDVTVMDGRPQPIQPEIREQGASGRMTRYEKAGYLPSDFDRPMLMIADMSEEIGRRIGLKTDWYCLCLDADAHHMRLEHPIFKGPFPVKLTRVMKPTPEAARTLPYGDGGTAPDSLLMWRVQKDGYQTRPGMRIGMVSRPGGFEDSPEAEMISGGVSAKTLDAVAIGRHGNFLHWGFAASPDDMTEEAKTVFANAIIYIAGFAGQTPIARKYDDRIITRHDIAMRAFSATRKSYELETAMIEAYSRQMLEVQPKAKEKQTHGEKLDQLEEMSLYFQPLPQSTYEEGLQQRFADLYGLFGADEEGYADYFKDNYPYFRPKGYDFIIDEDVRSLGIPNNDIRLLDKAIGMWEAGERVAKARRILARYTLCRFPTAAEWRTWFEANKSRLFFTEAGGWIFMVDTRDKNIPGNDYSVLNAPLAETVTAATAGTAVNTPPAVGAPSETVATDDRNPVRVTASAEKLPNGNRLLTVRMKIHEGYHIYASVAAVDPFVATTVEILPSGGAAKVGGLQKPAASMYNSAGTTVYKKEALFRQEISGEGDVKCIVGYQCCNETICMPPTEVEIQVK